MAKQRLDSSQYIGITEAGEVAFDLSCFDRLFDGNIIITKRLTDRLIDKLVEHKDRIILHLTCTGMGGSRVEPFVPTLEQTIMKYTQLIQAGFPISHIVLRIDPIVPTDKGIRTACDVVETFLNNSMLPEESRLPKRVRYSVLDMYKHVKERFAEAGFPIPYNTFHAPKSAILSVRDALKQLADRYGFSLESCAETAIEQTPCLSQKDVDILGLTDKIQLVGSAEQRKNCGCPANKKELLHKRPQRCENGCVYCFWRD